MADDTISTNRVFRHTDPKINDRIIRQMKMSVLYHEKNSDQIEERLEELNREWDVERMLETNASVLALFGIMGALFGKRSWLMLPIVVVSFLLQHAIQGWCPPIELFRRLGIRTRDEINRERNLLKAIRGDFDETAQLRSGDGQTKVENLFSVFKS